MTYKETVIVCLVVLIIALVVVCVFIYLLLEDAKEYCKNSYVKMNNLLCDFENEITQVSRLLQTYQGLVSAVEVVNDDSDNW